MDEKKMEPTQKIDVDNLLINLNPKGRFQITQYILLGSSFIVCAASFIKMVFIAYVPASTCSELSDSQLDVFGHEPNSSDGITYGACDIHIYNQNTSSNETVACINGYKYPIEKDKSFVSEWDLVCDNGALSELSQTLYAVGCFIGASIIPMFSDKYGRKPAHFVSYLFLLIVQMILAAIKNFWLFVILRMLEGALNYGMVMPAYSAMLELFPGSTRTVFAASTGIFWGFSMLLMTPIAYASREQTWRIICLIYGLLAVLCLITFWFVEESIRWLLTNNKLNECRKVVKKAAKQNGVNFEEVWEKCVVSPMCKEPLVEKEAEKEPEQLGFMTLVKDPLARMMSLILLFNSIMGSFTYYGIYMTAVQLAGNYYLNFFLTSSMEILGNVFVLFMLTRFDRRLVMLCFQIFSGIALIISVVIKFGAEPSVATTISNKVFTLFGMFGISASFCVVWLYAPEVYPTNIRNTGLGLMGMGSAFGNMIAPFSRYAARHIAWLPATIFGVGNVLGSLLVMNLPESRNAQMPTTMDDVRALTNKRSYLKQFPCFR